VQTMKLLFFGFFVVVSVVFGQSPAALRFEVASIKPANLPPGFASSGFSRVYPGGRLTLEMSPVGSLISMAYGLRPYQILGGPDWINSDRYNIEAKAADNASPAQINLMLQSLLEDRFKLKIHRDTRELPLYQLVVARGGPKIKLSENQNPPRGASPTASSQRGGLGPGQVRRGRGEFEANAVPIDGFVKVLSGQLDRPVIDKTELKGLYDILLRWIPELGTVLPGGQEPPPADVAGPSIFTAVQEQLGLKLEAVKGPVEVLVIDSVERPTEN
jgi:uncharacterized protein (TIGR03435 family)